MDSISFIANVTVSKIPFPILGDVGSETTCDMWLVCRETRPTLIFSVFQASQAETDVIARRRPSWFPRKLSTSLRSRNLRLVSARRVSKRGDRARVWEGMYWCSGREAHAKAYRGEFPTWSSLKPNKLLQNQRPLFEVRLIP